MKNKNDDLLDKEQNVEVEPCGCSNHKCKFCYAFITIALIILCAAGEYFFSKYNSPKFSEADKADAMSAIAENRKECDLSVSELKEDVSSLQTEVSKLATKDEKSVCNFCKNMELRKKWKAWLALKEKMEASEPFDAELETFNSLFSYDQELLEIVKDLAKGVDVISSTKVEKNDIVDTCKQYLRKVIRVKKIDYRKLLEVSGYVLSSVKETD